MSETPPISEALTYAKCNQSGKNGIFFQPSGEREVLSNHRLSSTSGPINYMVLMTGFIGPTGCIGEVVMVTET